MDTSFNQSVMESHNYPKNLLPRAVGIFDVNEYFRRLEDNSSELFVADGLAEVHFLELNDTTRGFINTVVSNEQDVQNQLRIPNPKRIADPLCRYVFLEARTSRDRLKITRPMFNMIMTYHQIMPAFLDFAFSFGDQEYQKDFNFSAIRLEENLGSTYLANEIPILKRSDRGFQLCYNLRSVEKVSVPEEWPWSIRQTATASQFDTQTHLSSWIVLKANSRLRRKIQTEASSDRFTDSHGFDTVQGSFAAYSLTHIMVCEWARGHWAQYITFLEKNMQEQTRHLTLQDVDKKTIRMPAIRRLERSRSTPAHAIRRRTTLVDNARQHIRQALTWMPSVAASTRHSGTELDRVAPATSAPSDEQEDRLFESLQDVHMLEEKANEALLIVRSNMSVMNELADHIGNMSKQAKFPEAIRADKCNLVPRLQNQIRGIVSDLKLQEARTENLLQLLGNRKAMLLSLMDYQTRVTAEFLAEKSQGSAETMEKLTDDMRLIAKKTEKETIFMRIVTVVTMFFLPGTFVSTLMSTDIIRFDPDRSFSGQALKYYLVITLPLMAMTFVVAYGIREFEQQRVDRERTFNDPEKGKRS